MTAGSDAPELPDWIIEGMLLEEEYEVLQTRARAAWRRRAAQEAVKYSQRSHAANAALDRFRGRLSWTKMEVRSYKKASQ